MIWDVIKEIVLRSRAKREIGASIYEIAGLLEDVKSLKLLKRVDAADVTSALDGYEVDGSAVKYSFPGIGRAQDISHLGVVTSMRSLGDEIFVVGDAIYRFDPDLQFTDRIPHSITFITSTWSPTLWYPTEIVHIQNQRVLKGMSYATGPNYLFFGDDENSYSINAAFASQARRMAYLKSYPAAFNPSLKVAPGKTRDEVTWSYALYAFGSMQRPQIVRYRFNASGTFEYETLKEFGELFSSYPIAFIRESEDRVYVVCTEEIWEFTIEYDLPSGDVNPKFRRIEMPINRVSPNDPGTPRWATKIGDWIVILMDRYPSDYVLGYLWFIDVNDPDRQFGMSTERITHELNRLLPEKKTALLGVESVGGKLVGIFGVKNWYDLWQPILFSTLRPILAQIQIPQAVEPIELSINFSSAVKIKPAQDVNGLTVRVHDRGHWKDFDGFFGPANSFKVQLTPNGWLDDVQLLPLDFEVDV